MSDQSIKLSALFEAAVEIESNEARREFIIRSCGDDATLRNELEVLLKAHHRAGSFLSSPLSANNETVAPASERGSVHHSVLQLIGQTVGGDLPRVVLASPPREVPGPIVRPASAEVPLGEIGARYRLDGEIARGGMGAILKGRDTDLGRDLAVKVLLDQHRDKPAVIQRFVEEAQIGGQLQHPGIVPVYELGQFPDKRPFFTMKLVKGETLSALLEKRRSPDADRARFLGIFEQVCQTMAYAHSRGVIHRDLKPSNVMVVAFGEVQVMDWGLAKVLSEGGVADEKRAFDNRTRTSIIQTIRSLGSDTPTSDAFGTAGSHTQMGSVMGTPAYMPPEQALGEIDRLDARSDVFGLGAILCEILTGEPAYTGETHTEVYRKAARARLEECFERLDQQTIDEELNQIVCDALQPEPENRIRDAGAFAERVGDYLASVETRMRQAELARVEANARAVEERKRRRVVIGLAASILVTLGVSGGGWLWVKQKDAELAKVEAAQRIEEMAERQQLVQQINGELATAQALAHLDEETVPTPESVDRAQAAVDRAQALLATGEVDDVTKQNLLAMATNVESIRNDFDLIASLDLALQKESDYLTRRANWERANHRRGNAVNAQGATQQITGDATTSDDTPDLFPLGNPSEPYEQAFAGWGLTLADEKQGESVNKLKALSPELQPIVFNSLDRWRNLLRAPRRIEEWQQLTWKPLQPVKLTSSLHDTFKELEDKSILAGGPTPWSAYELVFDTDVKEISALRLEAMLHDSLPNRGPGRSQNGAFRTELQVRYAPLSDVDEQHALTLGIGATDFQSLRRFAEHGHWHIMGGGGRPHVVVYPCIPPVKSDSGFRIWITSVERNRNYGSDSDARWGRVRFSTLDGNSELASRLKTTRQLSDLVSLADTSSWRKEMRSEIESDDILAAADRAAASQAAEQPSQDRIQLAEFLASRDNRQLIAHWPKGVEWHRLESVQLTSENGTELSQSEDGTINASGPNPRNETLTVTGTLPIERVSMVRLEVIDEHDVGSSDSKFGRDEHVFLNEVAFSVGTESQELFHPVKPHFVMGRSGEETHHSTELLNDAMDGFDSTTLALYDGAHANRVLLFALHPESTEGAESMRIQLRCGGIEGQNPRRFRLSVSDQIIPIAQIRLAARQLLERAVAHDPTDYRSRLALADMLNRQIPPDHNQALRHASAAVALRPEAAGGHAAILASLDVTTLIAEKAIKEMALVHAEKLRQIDPTHPEIDVLVEHLINHGHQLIKMKEHDAGEVVYRLALEFCSPNIVTYHNLIDKLVEDGRYRLAQEVVERSIEVESTDPRSLNWMGIIYRDQYNNEEAVNWFRKSTEVDPTYALGYRNWASRLTAMYRYDEAIGVLKKAIQSAPLDPQNYDDLGDILGSAAVQRPNDAIAAYRRATELAPHNGHYRLALALSLRGQRRVDEAIEVWEEAIERDPNDFSPWNNLSAFLAEEGRGKEAISVRRELVKLHPRERVGHRQLTRALHIRGQFDEADKAHQFWIEQIPGDPLGYVVYAAFLEDQGQRDRAIEMLQTAIHVDSRYGEAYYLLGELLEKEGRIDEAIGVYQRGIEVSPHYTWPYQPLARLLRRQGRFDEVIPLFQKAAREQPDNAMLLQDIAQAIAIDLKTTVDQVRWGVELAENAVEARPEWPYNYRALGLLHYRLGDFQEAIASFDAYLR